MSTAESPLPIASISQTKECLRDIWTTTPDVSIVPMLWGEPGIGKSSLVTQVANDLNFERTVKLIASKLRPEDLTGVPFPYAAGYSSFHPPQWLFLLTKRGQEWAEARHTERVNSGKTTGAFRPLGNTVLFLDELTLAPQDVQGPLLSLVEDRTLGAEELELDDHVRLVAAGNRASHGAFARSLSTPMKTRLTPHLEVTPTFEEWITYARKMGVYPPILAYLQQHPEMLGERVEGTATQSRETYAKPRTWFKASALCRAINNIDILAIALEGTVGPGAAREFMTFLRTSRTVPTVDEIAADPLGVGIYDDEPDISYLLTEIIYAAIQRDPQKYAGPLLEYAARMHEGYRTLLAHQVIGTQDRQSEEFLLTVLSSKGFPMLSATCAATEAIEKAGDSATRSVTAPASGPRRVR